MTQYEEELQKKIEELSVVHKERIQAIQDKIQFQKQAESLVKQISAKKITEMMVAPQMVDKKIQTEADESILLSFKGSGGEQDLRVNTNEDSSSQQSINSFKQLAKDLEDVKKIHPESLSHTVSPTPSDSPNTT